MSHVAKLVTTNSFFDLSGQLRKELAGRREGFHEPATAGLAIAVFISLIIVVWAIYALIVHGASMPPWALVLGIVFMFVPPGPIVTLILVYATRGAQRSRSRSRSRSRCKSR